MAARIIQAKQIQKKSRGHKVRQVRANWFKVTDHDSGHTHDVALGLNGGTCTCDWGKYRPGRDHRSGCSHVVAALNFRAMQQGRRLSVWSSERDALRQHRPMLRIGDGLVVTSRSD
jgi:hypothetical protein